MTSWQCGSLEVLSEGIGARSRLSSALVYVSRITRRRSGISITSGCANRRCSRILRNVSTNRLRSARRAEARTNNSCKAFRDGVNGGSTIQGVAARRKTSAARLLVCVTRRCGRRTTCGVVGHKILLDDDAEGVRTFVGFER